MTMTRRPALTEYFFALALSALALCFCLFVTGRQYVFLFAFFSVTVSAWHGGIRVGVFATLLATAWTSAILFWFPGRVLPTPLAQPYRDLLSQGFFSITALVIVYVMHKLQRAQSRTLEQNAWLGSTLNNIANAVISIDSNGLVEHMNPLAFTLTGWGPEAIGKPVSEVFKTVAHEPETGDVISSRKLLGDKRGRVEILISKSGKRYTIEDSSSSATSSGSKGSGSVLVFRDVTDQRRVEEELRKTAERYQIALESGALVAWDWDLRTDRANFTDLNHVLPQIPEEASGKTFMQMIHPDDAPGFRASIDKAIETHESFGSQIRCKLPGGEAFWVDIRGKPVYSSKGDAKRIIGVLRNITEQRVVEEIVREGQEQFRNLAENAKDGFISIDDQGKIQYANASCAELFGYTRAELIGQNIQLLIPERLRTAHNRAFDRYRSTGQKTLNWSSVEFIGRRRHGREVPVEMSFSESRSGQKRLFTAVVRDVSERKKTEEIVRAAQERLVLAQRIAGIGTYEWHIQSGRTSFSRELEALYGIEHFGGTHQDRMALIHPDDLPRVTSELAAAMESKSGEFNSIFRVQLADSTMRWIASNGKIFRDEKGEPVTMLGAEQDITAQKKNEAEREKLLASELTARERLALAQRAAGMGTYEQNIQTGEVHWTPEMEALFGLKAGAFDGRFENWMARIHPDDREKTMESISLSSQERGDYYVEYRVLWPDGSIHWLGNSGKVIFDSEGSPEVALGACLDVTQRRALEAERERIFEREKAAREQAERSNRLKDEFIATVSHELRTPLTAIVGWSKMLLEGGLAPELVQRGMESIDRNARAQIRLVEDLLDLSRITAGRMRMHLKQMNLADAVNTAIESIRPAAQARKIQLDLWLAEAIVNGDAERLHQVAYNILFNAVKFSEREGHIEIVVDTAGDMARLSVRDHGKGIAAAFLPNMFRLFSQEDASSTRRYGGMGLGLAIVKNLVELHGGTVRAESPGEGQGTTMTVEIPLHRTGDTIVFQRLAQRTPEPEPEPPPARPRLESARIMIVEDDADTRHLIGAIFRQAGSTVTEASSAEQALELFPTAQPDAMLVDIALPGEDGVSLLKKIRALPAAQGGEVPAVAFTANVRPENASILLAAGFQKYLPKPVSPLDVLESVSAVLGSNEWVVHTPDAT